MAVVQISVPQGSKSNYLNPTIFVSGPVVAFSYKLTESQSLCGEASGYSSDLPAWTVEPLDLTNWPDGPVGLCVTGVAADASRQDYSKATYYWWTKISNPAITVLDTSAQSNSVADFSIILSSPSAYDTILTVTTVGKDANNSMTAVDGKDYSSFYQVIDIPPGAMTYSVKVATLANLSGVSTSFGLQVSNPINATVVKAIGVCEIKP